jgi:hypothetical protein
VPTFFSTKFIIWWSKSLLFFIFHNFMVKINTFFAEWWSGPTSTDRQGKNTVLRNRNAHPICHVLFTRPINLVLFWNNGAIKIQNVGQFFWTHSQIWYRKH